MSKIPGIALSFCKTPTSTLFIFFSCVRPHVRGHAYLQQVDMDCANMNFDNTIFSFTRIMWLSNPTKYLSALVADWPCRAVLSEFVKTCSVVFEGHFEFYVQVGNFSHGNQFKAF